MGKRTRRKLDWRDKTSEPGPRFPLMGTPLEHSVIDKKHPIYSMLQVAVPLHAMKFKGESLTSILDHKRLEELGEIIHYAGEFILHRDDSGQHRTAKGFNALAESLARLAHCPGGVCAFGMKWEYEARVDQSSRDLH